MTKAKWKKRVDRRGELFARRGCDVTLVAQRARVLRHPSIDDLYQRQYTLGVHESRLQRCAIENRRCAVLKRRPAYPTRANFVGQLLTLDVCNDKLNSLVLKLYLYRRYTAVRYMSEASDATWFLNSHESSLQQRRTTHHE